MSDFQPQAVENMVKALRNCKRPVWGEYYDGPDFQHVVRVTLEQNSVTISVFKPRNWTTREPLTIDTQASSELAQAYAELGQRKQALVTEIQVAAEKETQRLQAEGWTQPDFASALKGLLTDKPSAQRPDQLSLF